ncbi:MAG: cytochrome c oxidase subunit II [Dinghuibacter sp.]|nr:cytochrome c oxidase subunit II [Dinghuibacter sp.]
MSFFVIAVIVLFFVIIFQIAKASEYVSVLKGEEKAMEQSNRVNGFLMLSFLVLGLIGIWWCQKQLGSKILPVSASKEGETIDTMMWWTLGITGFVLVLTQILLFWYAYKYQYKKDQKAYYFPHNNKLEMIWTIIPAVVMTGLVAFGMINWLKMTREAPRNAFKVGIVGKQFGWYYHYPGPDNKLGRRNVHEIKEGLNDIGLDFKDKAALDDIVLNDTMYLVKDSIVDMTIQSRDVIHDVGLPHFRMKMDAVPDMPTKLKFTPHRTTAEMRTITGNPDFVYEIACDQMCGNGHYKMRGYIYVGSGSDFRSWIGSKQSAYSQYMQAMEAEKNKKAAPVAANK